jgi:hypothetical protein
MNRYWVRFIIRGVSDPRPITFPIPIEWWCTGELGSEPPSAINCAIVDADDERAAWAQIVDPTRWPEAEESFIELRPSDWRPNADRFPPKDRS